MKRTSLFSLRMSLELLDKLEGIIKEGKLSNISEAIRYYVELGMYVESYKTMIKDPEFLKTIEELKQKESVFDWLETLNDSQMDAIATAIKMGKEKRYETRTFR